MATKNAIGTGMPIEVIYGGTGTNTLTDAGVMIGNGTNPVQVTAPGITQQTLGGVTGLDPKFFTLVAGTNMTITPNVGGSTITFDASGGGVPAGNASFFAYKSAVTSNPAGNGVPYTVIFNTETYDNGGVYNNATGVFTANATGLYLLIAEVIFIQNIGAALYTIEIITTGLTSRAIYNRQAADDLTGFICSGLFSMNLNDTASVVVTVTGTANPGVYGQNNQASTSFSGFRVT